MPVPAGPGPFSPPLSGPIIYDPQLSRVRLAVPDLDNPAGWVQVDRSTDEVRWSTVRGGRQVQLDAGTARLDDYEFAADVPNFYRLSAPTLLNANPFFETDIAGWTAPAGSIARSTAQAHEGVASLLLTPDGVTNNARTESERCTVATGETYHASAWVRCASARNVGIAIAWFTGAAVFISITVTQLPVAANTWTRLEADYVAPAGAGLGSVQIQLEDTPPTTDLTYIDEAWFYGAGRTTLTAGSITPVLDAIWVKSITRPFLNRKVRVGEYSPFVRPSRSGTFDVVGRELPIAVTDVQGSKRLSVDIYTQDAAEARALDLLLASGDILFIHTPATGPLSTLPSGYALVGQPEEEVLPTYALNVRRFRVPYTLVAAPGPDVVGVTYTCAGVLNDYATCADLLAAFATCADLLDNAGSAEDVIVQ